MEGPPTVGEGEGLGALCPETVYQSHPVEWAIGRALCDSKVSAMKSLDGADAGPTSTTSRERPVEGAARVTCTSSPQRWGGHGGRFRQADGSR